MAAALTAVILLAAVLVVFGTLAYGALSAAPWVPMRKRDTLRLLELLKLKPGQVLYDLGCGDGRVLVAAAKHYGVRAVGYEVALVPYLLAQLRRVSSGVPKLIQVRYQSFWQADLSPADAVACFLTPPAMRKLEPKLARELKPGASFATYVFALPNLVPTAISKPNQSQPAIYLYTNSVQ